MGSSDGVMKGAATRIGVTLTEYEQHTSNGEKWCIRCRAWHPRTAFGVDRSRADGLAAACAEGRKRVYLATYVHRPRTSTLGRKYAASRDGDKRQARARANHAVDAGLIPDPNDLPCFDCGHVYGSDRRRHEYDHYLGYSADAQLMVQAVCSRCHHIRERRQHGNKNPMGTGV